MSIRRLHNLWFAAAWWPQKSNPLANQSLCLKLFVSLKVAQRLTSRCDSSASVKSGIPYASHCGCSWQVAPDILQLFGRSNLTSMLWVHPGVSYLLSRPAEVMLAKERKMIGFIFLPDLKWNKSSHLCCAGVRVFCISPAAFFAETNYKSNTKITCDGAL